METFFIDNKVHLGDNIVILILAYNRALENNWIIDVYGSKLIEQLFEIYDFFNLNYCGETKETTVGNSISSMMPHYKTGPLRWDHAKTCFLKINYMFKVKTNPFGKRIKNIVLPNVKLKKTESNDVCYFQFDSRSLAPNLKRSFTNDEMKYILSSFSNKKIKIGLGGPNTIKYIDNYEFDTSNTILEIAQKMINCHSFIGIDSGLSHIL